MAVWKHGQLAASHSQAHGILAVVQPVMTVPCAQMGCALRLTVLCAKLGCALCSLPRWERPLCAGAQRALIRSGLLPRMALLLEAEEQVSALQGFYSF